MKTMKVALLATAALAAVTVSARADDASAIKAQLEALTARIAQLEAAPAAPVGYSLLTVSDSTASATPGLEVLAKDAASYGNKATVIGIMPTADMPASTTIEWSGYVRAAIANFSYQGTTQDHTSIPTRGQLKVVGKTDTAVGEVGVKVQLRAGGTQIDSKPSFSSNEYWGYWAMTPELTLAGGYTGSLGNIGYGYDGACNCYITDNADAGFNPGDAHQMRLSYASGPLSMGIAIEDVTGIDTVKGFPAFGGGGKNVLGVAGELKYTGDAFSGEISAVWHEGGKDLLLPVAVTDSSWQIGAGAGFALGDMANFSLAAATGRIVSGQKFMGVSALISANLSETVHAEIAGAYKNYGNSANAGWTVKKDVTSVLAGIYYDPVSQLTIGLEGEYSNPKGKKNNSSTVDLVTVFRF